MTKVEVTIPESVEFVEIIDMNFCEFYYLGWGYEGGDWQDMAGDYRAEKFLVLASVCEVEHADEAMTWECYRVPEGGWQCFGDEAVYGAVADTIAESIANAEEVSWADELDNESPA